MQDQPIHDVALVDLVEGGGTRRRLADIVYDQLQRLIERSEFPKGFKLPPENELCGRFSVSRPVLREALARLRDEGWVRSQRGSGTVVVRGPTPASGVLPPIRSIADLLRSYEFRIQVEVATAGLAAERRAAADLAELEGVLERARAILDERAFHLLADVNFSFHRAIAAATQNPYYLRTLEMMPNFVGRSRLDLAAFGEGDPRDRLLAIQDEHASILEAVRARDVPRAQAEMGRHIASAREAVLERQAFLPTPSRT